MSSPLLLGLGGSAPQELTCSRARCGEKAAHMIHWRNPKIHAEDRRKTWLACDEHVEYLREFLAARGFPVAVEPLEDTESDHGKGSTA